MALIENTLFGTVNKVDQAIQRIKMYDPIANGWLDEQPTIDAAPVRRSEWVAVGDDDQDEGMFFCSRCKDERWFGEEVYTSAEAARLCHYCPNCGADMRGVSE